MIVEIDLNPQRVADLQKIDTLFSAHLSRLVAEEALNKIRAIKGGTAGRGRAVRL